MTKCRKLAPPYIIKKQNKTYKTTMFILTHQPLGLYASIYGVANSLHLAVAWLLFSIIFHLSDELFVTFLSWFTWLECQRLLWNV